METKYVVVLLLVVLVSLAGMGINKLRLIGPSPTFIVGVLVAVVGETLGESVDDPERQI